MPCAVVSLKVTVTRSGGAAATAASATTARKRDLNVLAESMTIVETMCFGRVLTFPTMGLSVQG